MIKTVIFVILFYLLSFRLSYNKLDTKIKCGRFVGAFLGSATVFSPQITYDNNALIVIVLPFFFAIGFLVGFVYRALKPYVAVAEDITEPKKVEVEEIIVEVQHYQIAKKSALVIVFVILFALAVLLLK